MLLHIYLTEVNTKGEQYYLGRLFADKRNMVKTTGNPGTKYSGRQKDKFICSEKDCCENIEIRTKIYIPILYYLKILNFLMKSIMFQAK